MQTSTIVAAVLAPILGPALWWAYTRPGAAVHRYLWKRLPEGRLRRILLMDMRMEEPRKPFS